MKGVAVFGKEVVHRRFRKPELNERCQAHITRIVPLAVAVHSPSSIPRTMEGFQYERCEREKSAPLSFVLRGSASRMKAKNGRLRPKIFRRP